MFELDNERLVPSIRNRIAFFIYDCDADGLITFADIQKVMASRDQNMDPDLA
jgi:Ca2+-binding EF-hand superfamily protein